jgi:hypothetical protein
MESSKKKIIDVIAHTNKSDFPRLPLELWLIIRNYLIFLHEKERILENILVGLGIAYNPIPLKFYDGYSREKVKVFEYQKKLEVLHTRAYQKQLELLK